MKKSHVASHRAITKVVIFVHSTSTKNGVPVMTKPHPTNPDYEYVYYYDYEDEDENKEDADDVVRATQSSPTQSTRPSPSRVSVAPERV